MAIKKQTNKYFEKIVKQFAGTLKSTDGELVPEVAIAGTGNIWCYSPSQKAIIKVSRGIKAFIINQEENEYGKILIYTFGGDVVEIELSELIFTGFD
tara:strand:+ start:4230 stop:4520 length:291 start_codon:yes stop_codon:yes gene_type:complete